MKNYTAATSNLTHAIYGQRRLRQSWIRHARIYLYRADVPDFAEIPRPRLTRLNAS